MWVNGGGKRFWVKYHFHADLGWDTFTNDEAAGEMAGIDADYHRRDLFEAIARGDHPTWTVKVQVMPYEDAKDYRFNPFDLTKIWPHGDYPLITIGRMTLDRNPENFFAQIEQACVLARQRGCRHRPLAGQDAARPGLRLRRRAAQPHRRELPAAAGQPAPRRGGNTYQFDGPMAFDHAGDRPKYAPNSYGARYGDATGVAEDSWEVDGEMVRAAYELHAEDDDFGQAGTLVREV